MKKTLLLFATLAVLVSCQQTTVEPGVSRELALERHARVSELSYGLDFSIPDKLE